MNQRYDKHCCSSSEGVCRTKAVCWMTCCITPVTQCCCRGHLFHQDKTEIYIKQWTESHPPLHCLPIVNGSAWVSAVLDVNHQNGKTQEPHTHAKADAVHRLVAHKHLTVDIGLQVGDRGAGPVFTEAWDLQWAQEVILTLQSIFIHTGGVTWAQRSNNWENVYIYSRNY